MKLNILSIVLLLCSAFYISCKQATKTKDDKRKIPEEISVYKGGKSNTSLSGNIKNATSDFIVLSQDEFKDTIPLSSNGSFETKLFLEKDEYFLLNDSKSNIRIFLEPNYNLSLVYDALNTFNSISFEGYGKQANIYLKDKYLLLLDNALPLSHLYDLPPDKFRFQVDSMFVISKMFYNEMVASESLPELFKQTELASLKYERASKLLEYIANTSNSNIDESSYLKFLDDLSVNEGSYLNIYEYRSFINAYIDLKAKPKILGENLAQNEIALIKMQTVNMHIQNQEIKDYLLYTQLKQYVKYYGFKNADMLFNTFEYSCKNEEYLQTALNKYNEYQKLSELKPAPNFKMDDENGKQYALKDFKGSYIYIDVWASWCLPCKKEAPIFEDLKNKYAHKNVVFLSISIDKTKKEWLDYLNNKNMYKENQFIAQDKKKFLDSYMIQTIPHFLIIDDEGNLIDNNAPRPSEGKTEWLEELPDKAPA